MAQALSLSLNGVSDAPPVDYFELRKTRTSTPIPMDTTNDGYGWNLGTLFKGWELYNDSNQTSVPTTQATAAGEKAAPNYLLYGGIALAAILLLRR
jgi:hypothetical protein